MDDHSDEEGASSVAAASGTSPELSSALSEFEGAKGNPRDYDSLLRALLLLRRARAPPETLAELRELFSANFPLTEEIWTEWINDEVTSQRVRAGAGGGPAGGEEDAAAIDALYKRALGDYLSLSLWQDRLRALSDAATCSGVGAGAGHGGATTAAVRATHEEALLAAGSHREQGSFLFSSYRAFEERVGDEDGAADPSGGGSKGGGGTLPASWHHRVLRLFLRQLALPLAGNEDAVEELEAIAGEVKEEAEAAGAGADAATKAASALLAKGVRRARQLAKASAAASDERSPFELDVAQAVGRGSVEGIWAAWEAYIDFELAQLDPGGDGGVEARAPAAPVEAGPEAHPVARAQCLFERAAPACCLSLPFWQRYTAFADEHLLPTSAAGGALAVHRRAVRNLTWDSGLLRVRVRARRGS